MSHYIERLIQFVVDFANTFDPFLEQPEFLQTPENLQEFLERHQIQMDPITEEEFLTIHQLRDHLRDIFLGLENHEPAELESAINDLLGSTSVRLQAAIHNEDEPIDIIYEMPANIPLSECLKVQAGLGLTLALQRYGVARLKVCAASPCQEVFIDISKNKSRRFCGDRCANRYNVAHFRERQRSDKD